MNAFLLFLAQVVTAIVAGLVAYRLYAVWVEHRQETKDRVAAEMAREQAAIERAVKSLKQTVKGKKSGPP
jgi:precorrin-3B methylase